MANQQQVLDTEKAISDVLATIEREREREIITRRFGLFDRKETLEQIGELLGITRERVRQLEKSIMARLIATGDKLPHIPEVQTMLTEQLQKVGGVGRVSYLKSHLTKTDHRQDQARISFLAIICPELSAIEENDLYYGAVSITKLFDEKQLKAAVEKIVAVVSEIGHPASGSEIAEAAKMKDASQAEALASVSKQLATLNGQWGLIKWPMVNPKNIRDKIYVILKQKGQHMHFNEISASIKSSDFKRKDVTTQAIHNELIKDKRFVLIGRGIYALREWGYEKGTVADIIVQVLKDAGEPLHRDEIVKRVLKSRFVKETTILLNLQGKPQFKRVAKATYTLAESK